jgi:hypothetical protein
VAVLQQHGLGGFTGLEQFGLQQLGDGGAKQIVLAAMLHCKRIDLGGNPRRVEVGFGRRSVLCSNAVHEQPGYRTAQALSR